MRALLIMGGLGRPPGRNMTNPMVEDQETGGEGWRCASGAQRGATSRGRRVRGWFFPPYPPRGESALRSAGAMVFLPLGLIITLWGSAPGPRAKEGRGTPTARLRGPRPCPNTLRKRGVFTPL